MVLSSTMCPIILSWKVLLWRLQQGMLNYASSNSMAVALVLNLLSLSLSPHILCANWVPNMHLEALGIKIRFPQGCPHIDACGYVFWSNDILGANCPPPIDFFHAHGFRSSSHLQ